MAEREGRAETSVRNIPRPAKAWLMGFVAWLVPGLGHVLQGRWGRGLLLGGAVWMMFIGGLLMGGHLYSVSDQGDGSSLFLQLPPMMANLGAGAGYLFCWLADKGFAEQAENMRRATFEYGNTFLLVAGLLNYLSMLDAFDIAAGRKS